MISRETKQKNGRRIGGERREGDAQQIADVLSKFGRVALRVQGTSMLPWVKPGDVALISRTDNAGIRFGDVAVYRRGNFIYVHRIVKKSGPWHTAELTAKGDAHPTSDGVLEKGELLGRVVRLYRDGERIDLDSPYHLALGLAIAKLSKASNYWYPLARLAAVLGRPIKRFLLALRAPDEVPQ